MNRVLRPVVRHELRELAGSRLLWVGLALTGLLVYSAAIVTWPTLAGDDLVVVRSAYLLGGCACCWGPSWPPGTGAPGSRSL